VRAGVTGRLPRLALLASLPLLLGGCDEQLFCKGMAAVVLCGAPERGAPPRAEILGVRVDNPTPEVGESLRFTAVGLVPRFAPQVGEAHTFRWSSVRLDDPFVLLQPPNTYDRVEPDRERLYQSSVSFDTYRPTRLDPAAWGRVRVRFYHPLGDRTERENVNLVQRPLRVHTAAQRRQSAPPIARFTATRDRVTGSVARFDASASSDPDGHRIVAWRWRFGDGTELDQNAFDWGRFAPQPAGAPAHQYREPGTYRVTLTVVDEVGRASEPAARTVEITREDSPPGRPPRIGAFNLEPNPALVDQNVTFSAYEAVDPDGDIDRYEWDLDGQPGFERITEGPVTIRSYTFQQEITVTVRVVDQTGLSDTASEDLSVIERDGPPPGQSVGSASAVAGASAAGRLGPRRAFEAELRGVRGARRLSGGRLRAVLYEPAARPSWAERTLQRFLRAPWRSRISAKRDRASGSVKARGVALARAKSGKRDGAAQGKREARVCLRLRVRLRPGALPSGRLSVIGGSGRAARLRGTASLRFAVQPDGTVRALGTLRAGRGAERPLPRACRSLGPVALRTGGRR
jgi:PKD repeat protein